MLVLKLVLFCTFLLFSVKCKPVKDEPICGYESCPFADAHALNVHLVPHSHNELGWMRTVDQYYFRDVQNELTSVIHALKLNPDRKFVQAETAYFKKWWEEQQDNVRQDVINLINNGQLEIVNGGWSINDEAVVNYQYTIDQYTLGFRYLEDRLGKCARARVAWQIDTFGHSREQASIAAQMGFDGFFFDRLDYREHDNRLKSKTMEMLWRGSTNLGNSSDIFTSIMFNFYGSPPNFCFHIACNDDPIIVDGESLDYNYERRVKEFATYIRRQAAAYPTNNIMVTMGDDFEYEAALSSYINIDRIIEGFEIFPQTNDEGDRTIKVFYSTPSCYVKAVNEYVTANNFNLSFKTDDFFPHANTPFTYWSGYYTSRPTSKRFIQEANNILQSAKQLASAFNLPYEEPNINSLKEALAALTHHNAITGTALVEVTQDYHRSLRQGIANAEKTIDTMISKIISGEDGNNFQFSSCLLANVSHCLQSQSDQFTMVVYNPLSWIISSPIKVPVNSQNWNILDSDGNAVTHQVEPTMTDFSQLVDLTVSPFTLEFVAKDLPPMGFKVYTFKTAEVTKERVKIGTNETSFEIDDITGLLKSVTMNGVTMNVTQDLLYYTSAGGDATTFWPMEGAEPTRIGTRNVKTTIIRGDVYEGVLQEFDFWAKQMIKVYKDDRDYIEFDWLIGPVNVTGGGKEVISRFTTSLKSDGVFYTDVNGREMIKRIRNHRSGFNYTDEEPVSANYYPVTSRIVIKDKEQGLELAVLTDRAEGGSSLKDGQVELMIQRVVSSFDAWGLDDQQYGHGIVVRGKHYLMLGPSPSAGNGGKTLAAAQREVAKRKQLSPWTFLTNQNLSAKLVNKQFGILKRPLSENVQILTLEPWANNTVLLRLEHILDKTDDDLLSQEVTVDLSDLFTQFTITELKETTLAGNIPLEENVRMHWPGSNNDEIKRGVSDDIANLQVTLSPMQIRTFLCTVQYY